MTDVRKYFTDGKRPIPGEAPKKKASSRRAKGRGKRKQTT